MAPLAIKVTRANGPDIDITLDIDRERHPHLVQWLQSGQMYEPDVGHAMLRILRPGDTAIDVGANVGFFTCLMGALAGPEGHVLACEPDAENMVALQRNVGLSGLSNVTTVAAPMTDKAAEVDFYVNSDSPDGHALYDPALYPGNAKSAANPSVRRVQATTLDAEYVERCASVPRLIKIDVEGAEHRVLQGAAWLLADGVPFVIAECHPVGLGLLGSSPAALREYMAERGYDCWGLYFDGRAPRLIPRACALWSPHILNLLFATAEGVREAWPDVHHDPRG